MLYNNERPHNFSSMVGQRKVVENIRQQSLKDDFFQVYLLSGQFGSGKTTMARIIALAVNCKHKDTEGNPCLCCDECKSILSGTCVDVQEMDAASNTGVDNIRQLKEQVNFLPVILQKKVYIIDEVHMLSTGAFNALLKVLEEPPAHTIFILCTTEAKKIPMTVRSRAAKYNFSQISEEDMKKHLISVAKKHNIEAEEAGIRLICKNSDGSMRNALSLLEQAGREGLISESNVASLLGITDSKSLFLLLTHFINEDTDSCIAMIKDLLDGGKEPVLIVSELLDICADVLMYKNGAHSMVNGTKTYVSLVAQVACHVDSNTIISLIEGFLDLRENIRKCPGNTTFICGVIKMMSTNNSLMKLVGQLAKKVTALEQATSLTTDKSIDKGEKIMPVFGQETEKCENRETETLYETSTVENMVSENTFLGNFSVFSSFQEETEEKEDKLSSLYEKYPALKNTLCMCEKIEDDNHMVFHTKDSQVFEILKQLEKTIGKFPFKYKLVE